jgi:hypothetical protein
MYITSVETIHIISINLYNNPYETFTLNKNMVKYLYEVLEVFVTLFGPCHHVQCDYWNLQDLAFSRPWKSTIFHEFLLHIPSKLIC